MHNASLVSILNTTGLSKENPALYQLLAEMLKDITALETETFGSASSSNSDVKFSRVFLLMGS